jgi:hypothetical protein
VFHYSEETHLISYLHVISIFSFLCVSSLRRGHVSVSNFIQRDMLSLFFPIEPVTIRV